MAKALPYFKFYCSEWNDGDITLEDMKTQGVFINICSYYWSQECDICFKKLQKRFKNYKKQIKNLQEMKIIEIKSEKVVIKFLDKQWSERSLSKQKNRENGLKGGRPKQTETKPNGLIPVTETKGSKNRIEEEENRIDKDIKSKPKSFKECVLSIGVEKNILEDWLKVRKNKKATNTETAFNALKTQIDKCNLSANDCIKLAVENSWAGFKAEWVLNIKNGNNKALPQTSGIHRCGDTLLQHEIDTYAKHAERAERGEY